MILINEVKYACMECIRGHRSSMCRHHERPLLQVRSKGRPNVGTGNKNHRIAVFAEEVASSPEPEGGESCKDFPVVILKASDKQIIDLSNGQILGPYSENSNKLFNQRPVISSDSFINSSSCCSKGATKVTKSCRCNKSNVPKSKILKTYFDKHIQKQEAPKLEPRDSPAPAKSCCGSKKAKAEPKSEAPNGYSANYFASPELNAQWAQVSNIPPADSSKMPQALPSPDSIVSNPLNGNSLQFSTTNHIDNGNKPQPELFHNLALSNTGGVFEVVNIPSCSISGTCRCTSDCTCPGCVEHNNAPKPSFVQQDTFRNDAQYGSNLYLTSRDQGLQAKSTFEKPPLPHLPPVPFPKDYDAYANFFRQILGENGEVGDIRDPTATEIDGVGESSCECPDDACFCQNCEAHGIIDGYKLDDIFASRALADANTIKDELPGAAQR